MTLVKFLKEFDANKIYVVIYKDESYYITYFLLLLRLLLKVACVDLFLPDLSVQTGTVMQYLLGLALFKGEHSTSQTIWAICYLPFLV